MIFLVSAAVLRLVDGLLLHVREANYQYHLKEGTLPKRALRYDASVDTSDLVITPPSDATAHSPAPLETLPGSEQIPMEIMLLIFEHALDQRCCKLSVLASLNRSYRAYFYSRWSQKLRLFPKQALDQFALQGWSNMAKDNDSSHLHPRNKSLKLALFIPYPHILNLLYRDPDLKCGADDWPYPWDYWPEVVREYKQVSKPVRLNVETLGIATLAIAPFFLSSGLWVSNLYPNVKRLYVDATAYPLGGDMEQARDFWFHNESWYSSLRSQSDFAINKNQVESYALALHCSTRAHDEVSNKSILRKYVGNTFPNIRRFFLFLSHSYDDLDTPHMPFDLGLDLVASTFDELTSVRIIFLVFLEWYTPHQASSPLCTPEVVVSEAANGTMIVKTIMLRPYTFTE
jgi:hypothetical protein